MDKYREIDEEELLTKLSEEELKRLEDELEELDPDVSEEETLGKLQEPQKNLSSMLVVSSGLKSSQEESSFGCLMDGGSVDHVVHKVHSEAKPSRM